MEANWEEFQTLNCNTEAESAAMKWASQVNDCVQRQTVGSHLRNLRLSEFKSSGDSRAFIPFPGFPRMLVSVHDVGIGGATLIKQHSHRSASSTLQVLSKHLVY